MPGPTFVLLHGAWHSPKCWQRLITELEKAGCTTIAPSLPSCGSIPPTADWEGDIQVIRETISKLLDQGHQDIVVVMHSFSGMTGGTALHELDKDARLRAGLQGGVVRLIYICAFIVPESFQHSAPGTRDNMVPEMKTNLEENTVTVLPEDAQGMFYQDLDDATVAELVQDLRPQSFSTFWGTTEFAAWRIIPTTYVLTMRDKPTTVAAARFLVDSAKASGNHKIDKVIEFETGHSPFISEPRFTAKVLIEEAKRPFEDGHINGPKQKTDITSDDSNDNTEHLELSNMSGTLEQQESINVTKGWTVNQD
ncbi:Alpha/beta hydrolase fold-1 [Nemania sp. NC0429]|nr:Alpha/beta hydrolase fold-1 [Nemania sp. NC0429]